MPIPLRWRMSQAHGQWPALRDRGAGQRRGGRLAHRHQRAGQQPLPFLKVLDFSFS